MRIMTSSLDKSVKLWDVDSSICVANFTTNKAVTALDWTLDQNAAVCGFNDGNIGLWDMRVESGDQRRFRSHQG